MTNFSKLDIDTLQDIKKILFSIKERPDTISLLVSKLFLLDFLVRNNIYEIFLKNHYDFSKDEERFKILGLKKIDIFTLKNIQNAFTWRYTKEGYSFWYCYNDLYLNEWREFISINNLKYSLYE